MLLIIMLIALVVGVILIEKSDALFGVGIFMTLCGAAALVVSISIAIYSYATAIGEVQALNTRYEMLVYEYENDIFEDEVLGKADLLDKIQEWNEDCASNKALQCSPWIGICIPNIYDDFEIIDIRAIDEQKNSE